VSQRRAKRASKALEPVHPPRGVKLERVQVAATAITTALEETIVRDDEVIVALLMTAHLMQLNGGIDDARARELAECAFACCLQAYDQFQARLS